VFDIAQTNAIDELLSSGFHRAELNLLASEAEVVSKLGHKYRKSSELQDVSTEAIGDAQGAVIGALFYVGAGLLLGPVAAAGGTFVAMVGAAALGGGAGGLVGTWLAKLLGDQGAQRLQEQLDHGGLLLWVRTRDVVRKSGRFKSLSATPADTSMFIDPCVPSSPTDRRLRHAKGGVRP
jgi:hypothetical protein